MDPAMRRRAGKGQGTEDSSAESVPLQIAGIPGEAGDARDALNELEPEAGPLQLVGGAEGATEERVADLGLTESPANAAAGNVNLPVNPFWSQRMQDEARLAAARPAHLDETASDSTEMRQLDDSSFPVPKSSPVSFGPPREEAGDNLGVATSSTSVWDNQATGLRPGERIILTEMKGLMETIMKQNAELSVQNAGLRQRIDKLEEEKASSQQAWRSVGSGAGLETEVQGSGIGVSEEKGLGSESLGRFVPPERVQAWGVGVVEDELKFRDGSQTVVYQQGYEEGYLAAKQALEDARLRSPPSVLELNSAYRERTPEPPKDRMLGLEQRLNTTPQGTPVPPRPPPQAPSLSIPEFPSSDMTRRAQLVSEPESAVGPLGARTMTVAEMSRDRDWFENGPVMPSSLREPVGNPRGFGVASTRESAWPTEGLQWGNGGQTNGGHNNERDPWEGQDVFNIPFPPGRDPFNPGDRTFWNLPALEGVHLPAPATRAGDWLAQIRPLLYDLSEWSQLWWNRVEWEAQTLYRQWSRAPSIEKGLIQPRMSIELTHVRLRRLESRAYGMLQSSVPQAIRDELLATRSLHCVGLLFQILKVFAPGGMQERAQVLTELTNLGSAKSAADIVSALRAWSRCHARAVSMGAMIPDPALILRGVDALVDPLSRKASNAQVAFRLSTARNQLEIDHRPNMTSVIEYMRVLQSEWEQVSVSGLEGNSAGQPKVARVDTTQGNGGKDGEKGGKGPKGANQKGEKDGQTNNNINTEGPPAKAGGGRGPNKPPCSFYLTGKGCCKGRECSHYHDFAAAKGQGRCYNCGSEQHRQQECTRPKGKGPLGESTDSSATANASNSTPATTSRPTSAPSNSSKPDATPKVAATSTDSGGRASQPGGATATMAEAQAQVLDEAHKLLKSLRLAALSAAEESEGREHVSERDSEDERDRVGERAVVPQVCVRRVNAPRKGLLDGGATHPLRTACEEEWNSARPITVEMAVGRQDLRANAVGTILTRECITPICPLGLLVERLGCRVDWAAGRCRVEHPLRGLLNTELEGNCPVVSESLCLELIGELETFQNDRMQQALALRALNLGAESESLDLRNCVWGKEGELLEWLRGSFGDWPEHLVRRALPARCDEAPAGSHAFMSMNRRHRRAVDRADDVILHLFAGGEKGLQVEGLGTKTVILRVDERVRRDLLDEKTYMWLATLCSSGKVSAVVANPPSSTFKHVWANDGVEKGFKGLRGSTGQSRFGLGENSVEEQMSVDDQTVLLLRTLTLHHLAHLARDGGCMVVLQHPDRADDGDSGVADLERREPGWWLWPEFSPSNLGWYRAAFGVSAGRLNERSCGKAISTNSWVLYTMLHARTELHEIHDDPRLTWQPTVLKAVGHAISVWKKETARDRDDRKKEEEAAIKVLSKEELEFREHCEKDHIVFRKDCKVCLQAAMRGPKHIRQKYQHSNALCLNLDLIGPWIKGKDHILSAPARHILVATLGVPVFRDGKPLPFAPEKEQKEEEKEEKKEEGREEREGCENLESEEGIEECPEAGGIGEWILEDEDADEKEEEETVLSEEEYRRLCEEQEEKWRAIASELKEPVELHEITFAEPLSSKKASEVLRGIQRIYARIRLLNLEVRRTHSDGGREFTNRQFLSWCASRDIHPTYSAPGDPKGNGRIEAAVGRIKAGVRALLLSKPELSRELWPSALRQHVEQRFRQSLSFLGAEPPKRPLPPFGTKVTVQSRAWSRKTPYAPRAVSGVTLCPAANITGCTVVLVPDGDGGESKFHVAPVMYRNVKDQVEFEAEEISDEPPPPPPARRVRGKKPVVAHVNVGGGVGN